MDIEQPMHNISANHFAIDEQSSLIKFEVELPVEQYAALMEQYVP